MPKGQKLVNVAIPTISDVTIPVLILNMNKKFKLIFGLRLVDSSWMRPHWLESMLLCTAGVCSGVHVFALPNWLYVGNGLGSVD